MITAIWNALPHLTLMGLFSYVIYVVTHGGWDTIQRHVDGIGEFFYPIDNNYYGDE
ncbi:hypothetical protein [Weissella tructae]